MEESIIKKKNSTINKYFVLFQGYRKDNIHSHTKNQVNISNHSEIK
jgi:hypothetical protein